MMHAETAPPGAAAPVFYQTDEEGHHSEGSTMLGFWLYLMSDCLIFATLFATYGVLGRSFAAGPTPKELFDLPGIAVNTAMLLFSSITYGFAMLEMDRDRVKQTQIWLAITGLFGVAFVALEIREFVHLFHEGAPPWRSALTTLLLANGETASTSNASRIDGSRSAATTRRAPGS